MPTVHIVLISVYTLLFLYLSYNSRHSKTPRVHLISSPLNEAIILEKQIFHARIESRNPFKGAPSPELDHAWHQLFRNINVRVTSDDLRKINRTSVPLGDGSGYYAVPDVYHQLHCLNFLRQMFYNDYYHIDKSTNLIHIDHCIDNLRQNVMCKGDVSLVTFDWIDTKRTPDPNFDIEHECRNWESIDAWAKDHAFDLFDEKMLVHPTLGPSFPEAEYKNAGKTPGHPGILHEHGETTE